MPTIIIPDRICPHCGGDKWFQGKQMVCYVRYVGYLEKFKASRALSNAKWREREGNKERAKQKHIEWLASHPDIFNHYYHKRKDKDPNKYRNDQKRNRAKFNKTSKGKAKKLTDANKARMELMDCYIKSRFAADFAVTFGYRPDPEEISEDIIRIKRKQLKLKRYVKEIKNSNKSRS